MDLISLSRNNCGAPREVPESAKYLTCSHCGSRLAVQRTGTAYYTNLMEQITESSSQISKGIDALDKDKWETCEIRWHSQNAGFLKVGHWFIARALGSNGCCEAARSSMFTAPFIRTSEGLIAADTPLSSSALEEVKAKLMQDRWEPVVKPSRAWFHRSYRRRTRE